ncbi:rhodanese-like domain-containing protein [Flexibacterium corallicola]|uniref:rhodanese-like domain-containing protein n=1 Tax=Flexibacterium corallicola TaxID=3037259 RepID=UPI00286F5BBA|nr:rhodanese-like domain-containing protein [Pseudovibrio sp. M1P-2-3]
MELGYAGNVPVREAFTGLEQNEQAVLVDVRTQAEWNYVGVPNLSALNKQVLFVDWIGNTSYGSVNGFVDQLSDLLAQKGLDHSAAIYFLCRSGVRSQAAAQAQTAFGYQYCYNVIDGFEGPLDSEGHRGLVSGWKAEGLPWIQS